MCPHAGLLDQGQVAGNGGGLCRLGNTGQSESGGDLALVSAAVARQPVVIGIKEDRQIEGCGLFQCASLHHGFGQRLHGIADTNAAGLLQCGHLGKLLTP